MPLTASLSLFSTLLSLAPAPLLKIHDDFDSWLSAIGVERRGQVVLTDHAGRGLVATQSISPGGLVLKVPRDATIQQIECHEDNDDQWAGMLAVKLLEVDNEHPFRKWGLPRQAPQTLCLWTLSDLSLLQNSTLVEEALHIADWKEQQYHRYGKDFDRDAFMTALGLVCSRTLKARDGSRQLVPLLDMANHAPAEAGGGYFEVDQEAVYLYAGARGVKEGEPVVLDYGARPIEEFMLYYGFVPHRCSSDCVIVPVSDYHNALVCWSELEGYRGHPDESIRLACAKFLKTFPTSLNEDAQEINSQCGLSDRKRQALLYRHAKKSLLCSAAGYNPYTGK